MMTSETGLTWKEELNLLTKFDDENIGFIKLEHVERYEELSMLEKDGNQEYSKEAKYIRTLGRGRRMSSQKEDYFITRMIDETLGCAHRNEEMFNTKIPYMKNKEDVPTTRQKLKKKMQARLIDGFEHNMEKLKLDKNNVLVKEGMGSIGLD